MIRPVYSDTARRFDNVVPLLVLCVVATIAIQWLTFVGFMASDDETYLGIARGWRTSFPYVGDFFAGARHTVVIPIAISTAIFGESEWSLTLPALLYQLGIVFLGGALARRIAGDAAGVISVLLLATLPLLAILSSIASADGAELFFVALSLYLFFLAAESRKNTYLLLGSGVAAGFALLTRETSIALLLGYGILFGVGFGISRPRYFIIAAGFIAVQLADMLFFLLTTGDGLHRLHAVLNGVSVNDRPAVDGIGFDSTGALRVHFMIDPLLLFFSRIDFGLLGVLTIPVIVWLSKKPHDEKAKAAVRVLLLVAFIWLVFNTFGLRSMKILTRYYAVVAFCMAVGIGIWIGRSGFPLGRRRGVLVAILLSANAMGLYLTNKDPLYAPRALVDYLRTHADIPTVVIAPELAAHSETLLRWANLEQRVRVGRPLPGDIVVYATGYGALDASSDIAAPTLERHVIWTAREKTPVVGIISDTLGLSKLLPGAIYAKLHHPHAAVTAYQFENAKAPE